MDDRYNGNRLAHKVGIIGLGFVGLPLACAFASKGFQVTGIDLDDRKINMLRNGNSYIHDITDEELHSVLSSKRLIVSSDYSEMSHADSIVICVPTPLTPLHTPDLSYLTDTCNRLAPYLRHGQLIVVESSTYPGTTREVTQPLLDKSGLTIGEHIFVAYSPERIDPGSQTALTQIPKLVSGMTPACLERIVQLYSQVFEQVVPVSSTEVAEMAKLLENTFRLVNISFINEFAQICDKMNINVWEVIAAAGTKPYGFTPFYPGPGIGGHCIPVDPLYLQWKANLFGIKSKFIELSHVVNETMPQYVVQRLRSVLEPEKTLSGAKILIYGVTYKKNTPDTRESSALPLIQLLHRAGADVMFHDPLISALSVGDLKLDSVSLSEESLKAVDCVLIHTDHNAMPVDLILQHTPLVFDCRNATAGRSSQATIVTLGGGAV
ncbi:nucleotide sugar dehydrogenase [Paenibacillus chartarius]|uniref:Nucleotide sugar dehydrogenase n=1 Tax=Paenibacillus chartarius TaxID=747481 RepID=A0ABV6DH50_9BACL